MKYFNVFLRTRNDNVLVINNQYATPTDAVVGTLNIMEKSFNAFSPYDYISTEDGKLYVLAKREAKNPHSFKVTIAVKGSSKIPQPLTCFHYSPTIG